MDGRLSNTALEAFIIQAKKQYGRLYSNVIDGELYIWRLLCSKEYELISVSSGGDRYSLEDKVCEAALLYPTLDYLKCPAALPTLLAEHIIYESGFESPQKIHRLLNQSRQEIYKNFQEQAYIAIATAFPQYTFEEMETWDAEKLTKMIARAEWKLNVIDCKPFIFEETDNQEQEKKPLKEIEASLVQKGGDPILMLYHEHYKKNVAYMPPIAIVGARLNRIFAKEVSEHVRETLRKKRNS